MPPSGAGGLTSRMSTEPAGRLDDVNVCTTVPASGNRADGSGGMRRVPRLTRNSDGISVCEGVDSGASGMVFYLLVLIVSNTETLLTES